MSTYKVIQDIEAEDKLVGPLTLRQFIYAGVAAVCLYICFLAFTKHVEFLIAIFLPIAAVATFFAFPWKGEQPTEIWALARLRFMIKPRVRVWDQSGVKDLVTITAPKRLETRRPLTNNLSENEVRSRLRALADTIDSRGWATRNANFGMYAGQLQGGASLAIQGAGANPAMLAGLLPSDDMFDERGSVARDFDAMLTKSSQDQRQRVQQQIVQAQAPQLPAPIMPIPAPRPGAGPSNYWFTNGPTYPGNQTPAAADPYAAALSSGKVMTDVPIPAAAAPTTDELAFAAAARQQNKTAQQINYSHMRVLQPLSGSAAPVPGMINYGQPGRPQPNEDQMQYDTSFPQTPAAPVTRQPDPAILELAHNDDLDVATIARQANKEIKKSPDEVEIRLH